MTRLLPTCASGAFAAISAASSIASSARRPSSAMALTSPHCARGARVDPPADEEQLARSRSPDRVDEFADAGVRVDQPELCRGHPKRDRARGDSQVTGERELEPAADRVAVEHRERRVPVGLDRADRRAERVRHELLGIVGEGRLGPPAARADVVAGRERRLLAGDHHAACIERAHQAREAVEDPVIERASLCRVGDRQPYDPGRGLVDQQAAAFVGGRRGATRGQRACRPRRPTAPLRTGSP